MGRVSIVQPGISSPMTTSRQRSKRLAAPPSASRGRKLVPDSFYVGPQRPRLVVNSWQDVVAAAQTGVLDETHWVELKEDIPAVKAANLELAKDLASLSVDGGVLVVGVEDPKGKAGEVVGADLAGLADRITQVAAGRITPPLPVFFSPAYPNPDDDSRAVLIVTVPASETAPHMVDERYWGRNAVGKQALGDEQVRLLLEARRRRLEGFEDRLRQLRTELDPYPLVEHLSTGRNNSHLYLIAEPASAHVPVQLPEALPQGIDLTTIQRALGFRPQLRPSLASVDLDIPHADGTLLASNVGTTGDSASARLNENTFVRLLLADDGVVKVVSGAGTKPINLGDGAPPAISARYVLEFTYAFCRLVAHLAESHLGYIGQWRLGIYIERLARVEAREILADEFYEVRGLGGYESAEYLQLITSTTHELRDTPADVSERLTKRLLRGLALDKALLPYQPPT